MTNTELKKYKQSPKALNEQRRQIQFLGLNALKKYFGINPDNFKPETLKHLHNKARIAMQYEKEMNVSVRAVESNYIKVFKLVAEDKKELRELIKKTLPKYGI